MRILQLCTNFMIGGIQRHVLDLSRFLLSQGHTVVLAGDEGEWRPSNYDMEYKYLSLNQVAAIGENNSIFQRLSQIRPIAFELRETLKQQKIDIIHAHETAPAIVAKLAAFGLGIPIIFSYHGSNPERLAGVMRVAKRCANITMSPSQASLQNLVDLGLPGENTKVIGLGVKSLPPVSQKSAREFRRQQLGDDGSILVSSLSRLDLQKGVDMMIEVARKIQDKRRDIKFVIAGGGPLENVVNKWSQVAGVSDSIRFLGQSEDVTTILAASDIYLLTSRWEALPISIVEAFQFGLPIVATDCGGVKELVNPDVGMLLPVGDTNGIAAAIINLADNSDLRTKLGQKAHETSMEDRFIPELVLKEIEQLYQKTIHDSRSQ